MNIILFLIFLILLINLIIQLQKNYEQKFNILYKELNYLGFKIDVINLLIILFLYLISDENIRYEAHKYYVILPVFFIAHIFLSLKYDFFKETIILNIGLPYTFCYKFAIYYITKLGLIILIILNLLFAFTRYKKKLNKNQIIVSIIVYVLFGFLNIIIDKTLEFKEKKRLEESNNYIIELEKKLGKNNPTVEQYRNVLRSQYINFNNNKNKQF